MSNLNITGDLIVNGGGVVGGYNIETVVSNSENYLRLSDGTQICWGNFNKATNVTITLPVAFANNWYKVVCQHASGSIRGNYTNTGDVRNKTTTSFRFDSNHSEQDNYDYIAIGRWK